MAMAVEVSVVTVSMPGMMAVPVGGCGGGLGGGVRGWQCDCSVIAV